MSHQPERKEKNCLNCGTIVLGRYCQHCGQENIVPKQSVWGLITHFVYDIFHFDGKFFHTLGHLLFKPGFIPKQYVAGKRASYLDPIRMYLFTSAVFFLLFFSMKNSTENIVKMSDNGRSMTKVERLEYASYLHQQQAKGLVDSLFQKKLDLLLDTSNQVFLTAPAPPANDSSFLVEVNGKQYLARAFHKREDKITPGSSWWDRKFAEKWRTYRQKYADDERAMAADMVNSFVHRFPYLLFVSLPFFALILKLLYIRRKQFYYSDHAVFTLYQYIFTFILLLIYFLILELNEWLQWGFVDTVAMLVFLSGVVYLFIAIKRFYAQGWMKTLGKFLLLNILAFSLMLVLLVGFILFSLFQL